MISRDIKSVSYYLEVSCVLFFIFITLYGCFVFVLLLLPDASFLKFVIMQIYCHKKLATMLEILRYCHQKFHSSKLVEFFFLLMFFTILTPISKLNLNNFLSNMFEWLATRFEYCLTSLTGALLSLKFFVLLVFKVFIKEI